MARRHEDVSAQGWTRTSRVAACGALVAALWFANPSPAQAQSAGTPAPSPGGATLAPAPAPRPEMLASPEERRRLLAEQRRLRYQILDADRHRRPTDALRQRLHEVNLRLATPQGQVVGGSATPRMPLSHVTARTPEIAEPSVHVVAPPVIAPPAAEAAPQPAIGPATLSSDMRGIPAPRRAGPTLPASGTPETALVPGGAADLPAEDAAGLLPNRASRRLLGNPAGR